MKGAKNRQFTPPHLGDISEYCIFLLLKIDFVNTNQDNAHLEGGYDFKFQNINNYSVKD